MAAIKEQTDDLKRIIMSICQQFEEVTPALCKAALEPTLEKAKVLCPKDTHALVNSAYLETTQFRGQPRVEMGFARGGFPHYAVLVHEDLTMSHAPPTQAKFLQAAVEEDIADIAIRIGENYKAFMGTSGGNTPAISKGPSRSSSHKKSSGGKKSKGKGRR